MRRPSLTAAASLLVLAACASDPPPPPPPVPTPSPSVSEVPGALDAARAVVADAFPYLTVEPAVQWPAEDMYSATVDACELYCSGT